MSAEGTLRSTEMNTHILRQPDTLSIVSCNHRLPFLQGIPTALQNQMQSLPVLYTLPGTRSINKDEVRCGRSESDIQCEVVAIWG